MRVGSGGPTQSVIYLWRPSAGIAIRSQSKSYLTLKSEPDANVQCSMLGRTTCSIQSLFPFSMYIHYLQSLFTIIILHSLCTFIIHIHYLHTFSTVFDELNYYTLKKIENSAPAAHRKQPNGSSSFRPLGLSVCEASI